MVLATPTPLCTKTAAGITSTTVPAVSNSALTRMEGVAPMGTCGVARTIAVEGTIPYALEKRSARAVVACARVVGVLILATSM